MSGTSRAARAVVGILGSAGVAHFVRPEFFDPIVPDWVPGSKRSMTYLSGLAELTSAALVAVPATRRLGGWAALATFVAVYPANIQMAVDGGMKDADPPFDSAAVAWARLPLQFPMFWLAWRVIKGESDSAGS